MLDEFNRPLWPRLKRNSNHLILDPCGVTRPIDRLREMEARSRGGPQPTRIETDWWIRSRHFASPVDRTPMCMAPCGLLGLSSSGSILASAAARSRVEAIRRRPDRQGGDRLRNGRGSLPSPRHCCSTRPCTGSRLPSPRIAPGCEAGSPCAHSPCRCQRCDPRCRRIVEIQTLYTLMAWKSDSGVMPPGGRVAR